MLAIVTATKIFNTKNSQYSIKHKHFTIKQELCCGEARVIAYLGTPTHPQEIPCHQPRPALEFRIEVQGGMAVQGGKIAKIK